MSYARRWILLLVSAIVLTANQPVTASIVTVSTGDNPITAGSFNSGWWSDSRASNIGNDNYFTGFLDSTPNTGRGYFTFAIPSLPGPVSAAILRIQLHNTISPDRVETIGFFDVSTPAVELANRGSINTAIFDDLGTGDQYGSAQVVVGSSPETIIEINLNQAAIVDINASQGNYFSVGSSLLTLGQTQVEEGVFGFSADTANFLDLAVIPEPATGLLMIGALVMIAKDPRGSGLSGSRR